MAVVLLAGGTSGMGEILLNRLDLTGRFQGRKLAKLIVLDYFPGDSAAGAAALSTRLTTPSLVLHWDAASVDSTVAAAAAIDSETPHLDGVLITTGLGFHGNLADMSIEQSNKVLQRLMQVNAVGPSLLSQFCAQKLLASPYREKKNGSTAPTLLLLSSYSGLVGLPHRAAYCASKFALNGYLETIHAEFPQLRIVLVCPTSVSTGFRANWKADMAKNGVSAAAVDANSADLTADQCVAAVWEEFNCPRSAAVPGLRYAVLPTGMTARSFWLLRLPWIGERFVRPRILARSSAKL